MRGHAISLQAPRPDSSSREGLTSRPPSAALRPCCAALHCAVTSQPAASPSGHPFPLPAALRRPAPTGPFSPAARLAVLGGDFSRTVPPRGRRSDHQAPAGRRKQQSHQPPHQYCRQRTSHARRPARVAVVGSTGLRPSAEPADLPRVRALHARDALPPAGAHRRQGQPHHPGGEDPPQGGRLWLGGAGLSTGVLPAAAHGPVRHGQQPRQDHQGQHDGRHGVPLGRQAGLPLARPDHLPVRRRPHQRPLRAHRGALHRGPQEAGDGPPGRARRRVRRRLLRHLGQEDLRRARGGRGRGGDHGAPRVREERQQADGAVERHRAHPAEARRGLHGLRQAHLPAVPGAPRPQRPARAHRGHAHRRGLGADLAGRLRRRDEPLPAQAGPARDGPRPVPGQVQHVPEPHRRAAPPVRHRQERRGRVPRRQRRPAVHRHGQQRHAHVRAQGPRVLRAHGVRHQRGARRLHARHALPALDRVQAAVTLVCC